MHGRWVVYTLLAKNLHLVYDQLGDWCLPLFIALLICLLNSVCSLTVWYGQRVCLEVAAPQSWTGAALFPDLDKDSVKCTNNLISVVPKSKVV